MVLRLSGVGQWANNYLLKKSDVTKSKAETDGRTKSQRRKHRNKDNDFRLFTSNVRTLNRNAEQVSKYRADLVAIQEMRGTGQGIMQKRNHDTYHSCHPTEHQSSTEFFLASGVKHLVIGFKAVSDRLCELRQKGNFFNMRLWKTSQTKLKTYSLMIGKPH